MPTTPNKQFQRIRPIPDGLLPNTEVFYLASTNEVFVDYDDYFERMIQLNSSCWRCTMTGRSGLTYDEALKSESDAMKRKKKREEAKSSGKKATLSPLSPTSSRRAADDARKKWQIHGQQQLLEPLFRQADKAGVEQMDRWRQSRRLLSDSHIDALREAIHAAKEAERRRQLERQRREREALAEWRKPRDDLLCEDLKPFPAFKALRWPDWVPREHYWDILAISTFCHSFAPLLTNGGDHHRGTASAAVVFNVPQIATALVSRQISESCFFYKLLDTLLNTLRECIPIDDGIPADLANPDHIGNEVAKDFDHPVHGQRIRHINRDCHRQFKLHGVRVWELCRDHLDISEVIRQFLLTAGFYTKWRRQTRGFMHCYEDDCFIFVQQHRDIVELLEKLSVYALNPAQRVQLITTLMDQLLSHSSFRKLIDERIDALAELRKRLKQLKAVDQQHEKEARDALQHLQQQQKLEEEQKQQEEEEPVLDKEEQKARASAQRELAQLRRALAQLNEGRRVKEIGDLRERLLDAQQPLPWRAMADAREVHEFRAVQRHFHGDKAEEVLRNIYQLQGKMGMFLLGRDRAFRSYYYMNSAFIILCPRREDIGHDDGHCWGEGTPKVAKTVVDNNSGTEETDEGGGGDEEEEEEVEDGEEEIRRRTQKENGRDHRLLNGPSAKKRRKQQRERSNASSATATDTNDRETTDERQCSSTPKQNGGNEGGGGVAVEEEVRRGKRRKSDADESEGEEEEEEKEREEEGSGGEEAAVEEEEEADDCLPPLDPLMACTGGGGDGGGDDNDMEQQQCPVHNPPRGWPHLLFYVERDGVRKLLSALNSRGFRETELADNIALFRTFYEQEMASLADSTPTTMPMLGAHLFGFGRAVPKELREQQQPAALAELDLFDEVRDRLLELEKQLYERGFGTPHCSTGREEWRAALETYGDTSMLCRGNCVPLIRPTSPAAAALDGTIPSSLLNTANDNHVDDDDNNEAAMRKQPQQNGLIHDANNTAQMTTTEDGNHNSSKQYQQQKPINFLYTREELSNTSIAPLNRVQKLGIALMQLVHGIRRDCFFNTFMTTVQQRNRTVTHKPTAAFVEWQQALRQCQSASAVALFETTLEFAINWEFKAESKTVGQPKAKTAAGRRRRMPRGGSAKTDDGGDSDNNNRGSADQDGAVAAASSATDDASARLRRRAQQQHARQGREVNNLLLEAACMGGMAIGARKRKPVTKYGDVEMDVDKLNFEEEEKDEQPQQQQEEEEEEEEEEVEEGEEEEEIEEEYNSEEDEI